MASRKRASNHYVTPLGTGGYFPTAKRHTACYMLDDKIMIDAGSGLLRILSQPTIGELHILLSHIHIDHVLGLTYLYGSKEKLTVRPKVYCSVEEWNYLKNNLFSSRLFDPSIDFLDFVEIKDSFKVDGINIQCVPQQHGQFGSRGFIFDDFLAYFTDTQLRKELDCSVDLLLHEAYSLDKDTAAHCSVASVKDLFMRSKCKWLEIIHINPNFTDEDIERMEDMISDIDASVINEFTIDYAKFGPGNYQA